MEPMTRAQILKVSPMGDPQPGPSFRRIDCAVPGLGVEVWATMVCMGGPSPRYTLEDIHLHLADAGHPPLFKQEGEAVDWLVEAINGQPIGVEARAVVSALAEAEAAKTETRRVEELIKARAVVEAAERRALDQTQVF